MSSPRIEPDDLPKRINLDFKHLDVSGIATDTSLTEIAAQATAKAVQEAINKVLLERNWRQSRKGR